MHKGMNKLRGELPAIIRSVGFDFHWSEEKVWQLDLPIEDMPIDRLLWHMNFPFWRDEEDRQYRVMPQEVLQYPALYPSQYQRILHADMRHPLDVMWRKGRWVFLDGLHRFARAVLDGATTVKVRKVPVVAIPLIRVT